MVHLITALAPTQNVDGQSLCCFCNNNKDIPKPGGVEVHYTGINRCFPYVHLHMLIILEMADVSLYRGAYCP